MAGRDKRCYSAPSFPASLSFGLKSSVPFSQVHTGNCSFLSGLSHSVPPSLSVFRLLFTYGVIRPPHYSRQVQVASASNQAQASKQSVSLASASSRPVQASRV
jgi:hypothetical protein